MRATQRLRERLRTEVPQALSAALNAPLPRAVLQSRAAQRSAQRLLWVLDRVHAERFAAKPIGMLRQELQKLAGPEAQAAERTPSAGDVPQTNGTPDARPTAREEASPSASSSDEGVSRATTDKPMPEMIRTTGGRRVPGSIAHRAVAQSGADFKPKKGKK